MDPPTFIQRAESICECASRPPKWHIHEGHFAQSLEFSTRICLDNFILRLERGGSGCKKDGTWKANPRPYDMAIDLKDESVDNLIGLHFQSRGDRGNPADISDPSPAVVEQKARWFTLGHSKDGPCVRFADQIDIVRFVCGTHRQLKSWPVIKARRQELWKAWSEGDERGKDFETCDLPVIAGYFSHCWDAELSYSDDGMLTEESLHGVKAEILDLLVCSIAKPEKSACPIVIVVNK